MFAAQDHHHRERRHHIRLGDYQDGMIPCPADGADPYLQFSTVDSRFVDDVRSWQTAEPALDMTGSAILGLALQEVSGRG